MATPTARAAERASVIEPPRWLRLEQRLEGVVALEQAAPRPEALELAMERAGYRRAQEPSVSDAVGYRDAATPSLSMRFVTIGKRGNSAVKSIRVFRVDGRTMGYAIACAPLWLLQIAGVAMALGSVIEAAFGDPRHHPWIVGLIAAGILLGLPKLWIDDARQVLREAIESAVDAAAAPSSQRVRVEAEDAGGQASSQTRDGSALPELEDDGEPQGRRARRGESRD